MTYIRFMSGDHVELGGQVATDEMIADGWFEYDGVIPLGEHFKLVDGVLVAFTPELSDSQKYHAALEYLNATDHKTYADYEPRDGEIVAEIIKARKKARRDVRSYLERYIIPSP